LQQTWPGHLEICQDADELGPSLVEKWLCAYMSRSLSNRSAPHGLAR
jgi:hypothetical protein